MKIAQRLLATLAVALLLLTGLSMLWNRFPRTVQVPPHAQTFFAAAHRSGRLGVLFLATAAGWLVTSGLAFRRPRYVSFDNPGGAVRVSVAAISEFLSRLSGEFPWLVSVRPVVEVRGQHLKVDMQCRVKAGVPLPELSRGLQDRVRDALAQSIGLTEVDSVAVSVRGVVGEPQSPNAGRSLPPDYGGAEPVVHARRGDRGDANDSDHGSQHAGR